MPCSTWEDVAGRRCEHCGGPATHFYGNRLLCCDCHAGPGLGLHSEGEAAKEHARVILGKPLFPVADLLREVIRETGVKLGPDFGPPAKRLATAFLLGQLVERGSLSRPTTDLALDWLVKADDAAVAACWEG